MKRNSFESLTQEDINEISLSNTLFKLKLILTYVKSKWLIIISISLLGLFIGYLYAKLQKPQFIATTSFVLEDSSEGVGSVGQYAGVASMVGLNIGNGAGGIFQGDNLVELYKSRSMLTQALLSKVKFDNTEKLLIEAYLKINGTRENWKGSPLDKIVFKLDDNTGNDRVKDSILSKVVEDIRENLISVEKMNKKLSILQVEITSANEEFSKLLNEQIVAVVNNFYISTKSKKSLANVAILQHQTDSVRNVLNGAIYQTAMEVDAATPNLNPARQILKTSGQRSQFNAEANKAILSQLVQNLELAKISLRKETPLIQIIDAPILPLPKQQLGPRKAAAVGFMLFAFLTTSFFIIKYILKDILKSE